MPHSYMDCTLCCFAFVHVTQKLSVRTLALGQIDDYDHDLQLLCNTKQSRKIAVMQELSSSGERRSIIVSTQLVELTKMLVPNQNR